MIHDVVGAAVPHYLRVCCAAPDSRMVNSVICVIFGLYRSCCCSCWVLFFACFFFFFSVFALLIGAAVAAAPAVRFTRAAKNQELFTSHDPTRGSGRGPVCFFKIPGRVGWVGSARLGSGRVGLGQEFFKPSHVGSGGSPFLPRDPIRPDPRDLTRPVKP